jgi:hypothetical protein
LQNLWNLICFAHIFAKTLHDVPSQPAKVRPLRVAARRQRELMVLAKDDEVEWIEEETVAFERPPD